MFSLLNYGAEMKRKRHEEKFLQKKAGSYACQLSSEVTPYHSGSLSHH